MFPQCPGRPLVVRGAGRTQLGGSGVAGGGAGGGPGALGAFGGPDQGGEGLAADLGGVGVIGDGVQRIEVMPGDDISDLFAVAGEDSPQVSGDHEVAGFAVTTRHGVVGDLAQQLLGELIAAPLRRQRVRGHGEHLAAHEVGQRGPDGRFVLARDRDQRLGRERGA